MNSIGAERRPSPRVWPGCRALILIIAAAALIAGCGGRTPGTGPGTGTAGPGSQTQAVPAPDDGKTRVALLLPLTGQYTQLGTAMRQAAEMALFDAAAEQFVLTPIDTQGTPQGARQALSRARSGDAVLILGPLFSGSTAAIKPEATRAGLPVLSFSNDTSVAGDGVYILGFLPQQQVDRVVSYAAGQGVTTFAALAPDTPFGRTIVSTVQASAAKAGASVARTAFYPPDESDVSETVKVFADYDARQAALQAEIRQLQGSSDPNAKARLARLEKLDTLGDVPYDAVLLPEGGTKLQIVASLLAYYDVDPDEVHFLGTGQWDDPVVPREPTLHGGWFAAPPAEMRAQFEERYAEAYGSRPPRLATLAYDAVAMVATLAKQSPNGLVTHEMITQPEGFFGMDGLFRLRSDGLNERGLAVLEVERGGFQAISPAPKRFPVAGPAS